MRACLIGLSLVLLGCGDEAEDLPDLPQIERPSEVMGSFYDSVVVGLEYTSPSHSGVTDGTGLFDIQPGEEVSFSVGAVALGTAQSSAIMTPLDFLADGDLDSPRVLNTVRFLLMLDKDGDPQNGIEISEAVRTAASGWSVNFDVAVDAFGNEVSEELAEANSINGTSGALWDVESTRSHLEATYLCAFSGMFSGISVSTVTGTDGFDDEAVFTVVFREAGLGIKGFYSDTVGSDYGFVMGESAVVSSERAFLLGDVQMGGSFAGAFSSANWLEGTWDNPDEQEGGTFSGARVGYQDDAKWRFTGTTSEGDEFSIDIDSSGQLTGAVMLVDGPALASATIEGTADLQSQQLSATVTTPEGEVEIVGAINDSQIPSIDGTFEGGSFSGTGCRLR